MNESAAQPELKREVGVPGAVLLGLGSIVGTGVFVSIGIAAGVTGPSVLIAIGVAAFVAMCNAFSSAQLAASHPVSGGTYEYGYRYLNPTIGYTAGWLFLSAKSASAATAALGFAGYLLHLLGGDPTWIRWIALGITLLLTVIVLSGMRRTNLVNGIIVSITLFVLAAYAAIGFGPARAGSGEHLSGLFDFGSDWGGIRSFLEACALMFVAYTGYGRIATLGEEVKEPRKTIPKAIVATLIVSAVLYAMVGYVSVGSVGAESYALATEGDAAPLEVIAETFGVGGLSTIVALGAMTAMLGVLLNLVLGLSRVLLAMGRRNDAPSLFGRVNEAGTTPVAAVIFMGLVVAGIALTGSVKLAWSFSAFNVLVYYAFTNLAALKLAPEDRLYPRIFAWLGLGACLFLAFWVEWKIWLVGLGLIGVGHGIRLAMPRGR